MWSIWITCTKGICGWVWIDTLNWYTYRYLIDTQLTLGRPLTNCWLGFVQDVDQVSTEYWSRCPSSVDQECWLGQLSESIDTRPRMPLIHWFKHSKPVLPSSCHLDYLVTWSLSCKVRPLLTPIPKRCGSRRTGRSLPVSLKD